MVDLLTGQNRRSISSRHGNEKLSYGNTFVKAFGIDSDYFSRAQPACSAVMAKSSKGVCCPIKRAVILSTMPLSTGAENSKTW